MGVYSKLLELQRSIRSLSKDAEAQGSYSYLSGNKLLSIIRPKMDDLGLILKQEVLEVNNIRQDYEIGRGEVRRPKSEILSLLKMKFTWLDTESGEIDENLFVANGMNGWDKGIGTALTYGERYFLMKYFHLSTDEDDCDTLTEKREKEEALAIERALREEEEAETLYQALLAAVEECRTVEELKILYEENRWKMARIDEGRTKRWYNEVQRKKKLLNRPVHE